MKEKTAMQQLMEFLEKDDRFNPKSLIAQQFLGIEKLQIEEAYITGVMHPLEMDAKRQAELYYNANYDVSRRYDGCLTCKNNIPGVEAGKWCINNCIAGSKYEAATGSL